MKENHIRELEEPKKPREPYIYTQERTSLKDDIGFVAGALRKDSETIQEPIIHKAKYAGSFRFLPGIQSGANVKEGEMVGYLEVKGLKTVKIICAQDNGTIFGLLKNGASRDGAVVGKNEELFKIIPAPKNN